MPSIVDALKEKYKENGATGGNIAEVISSMSTTPSYNIADALKGFDPNGGGPSGGAIVGTAKVGTAKAM